LNHIAKVLIHQQNKYEEARDYLQRSEVISSEIKAKPIQRDNHYEYYQLEKALHNYPAALHYCEKYNALKEEIFNEENARKTSEMKISFELDQKEKEAEIYRQRSIELVKANTELKRLKDNLELRVQEGIEENRKKDSMMIAQSRLATMGQMISFIAHQWKQPLNAISVITQNIEDAWHYDELNEEKLHDNSTLILNQIKFMADTIDDFRNFFKPDIEKSDFYPGKIIRKTIQFIEKNFHVNDIEIKLDLDEKCLVRGMPNELSQVVLNILNNARDAFLEKKRNPEQRTVKITLYCHENNSIISFRDNAGGIPENVLPHIFESYFSTKGNEQGTGLGLSMCKTIIEGRMLGKLTAENIENGAEFRIVI
jgi:C4-dicarboxylate-specific signal transduction histidine kinase